jgi:hypothetical protein
MPKSKTLTLEALSESYDSIFTLDLPKNPSLELITEARKAALFNIDFVSWHVDTPELLAQELDQAVKKLTEISLARLRARSNPKDAAYLKREQAKLDRAFKRKST